MTAEFCIQEELATLPAKVRKPFESLLAVGQIDESALELVLRAGRHAGNVSMLVGFAVGYLFMTAKGIPVADVIRMSEQLHRRINLSWSERRWRDEHSRLARAVTLQRLTAASVRYDLSTYQKHLPRQWPGYLIRSSRRLGMEGLRQRHCVASYHDQIQRDNCAIAVVFLERQRWTVQLVLTRDRKRPLAIGQTRRRDNGCASKAVSEALHEVLGIEYVRLTDSSPVAATQRFYRENLRRVLPVLQEQGTQEVRVSFDGSGDSGSIEEITFHPDLEGDPPLVSICKPRRVYDEGSGSWLQSSEEEEAPLKVAIEELTYDYLDETDVDWYNNDGGYGDLVIDVPSGTVELTVNRRFSESNCEYSGAFDIASGEAL